MRKTVLVVEPEQHIARLIEVNLERAGYEVLKVASRDEALIIAKAARPDLIVASTEAAELTAILSEDPLTANIEVIEVHGDDRFRQR